MRERDTNMRVQFGQISPILANRMPWR